MQFETMSQLGDTIKGIIEISNGQATMLDPPHIRGASSTFRTAIRESGLDDFDEKSGKTGTKLENHFSLCKNGEGDSMSWFSLVEFVFAIRTTVSDLKENMARLSDREDKNQEQTTENREHIIRLEQKVQVLEKQLEIRNQISELSKKMDRRLSSPPDN